MTDIQTLLDQRHGAFNRRDAVALAAGYAEDAVVTSPMFPRASGRPAIQQSFMSVFHAFPDWDTTFEESCVSGNRVVEIAAVQATQRGDFMGIPGTGKRVAFDCVLILDLEDGLIKRERRIYDFTGMLIQLGVLRAKPAG